MNDEERCAVLIDIVPRTTFNLFLTSSSHSEVKDNEYAGGLSLPPLTKIQKCPLEHFCVFVNDRAHGTLKLILKL